MKHILILFFILKLSVATAKIGIEGGAYGEYFRTYVPFTGGKFIFSGGVVVYVQLGKYITLNYRFGGGNYSSEYRYIHCPASWGVAGYLINNNGNIWGSFLGIIPEGIGFYTRKDHSGVHIALNPLSLEYFYKRNDWDDIYVLHPEAICRYRFRKESKFQMISPYAGLGVFSSYHQRKFPDFKIGLSISFESGTNKKEN